MTLDEAIKHCKEKAEEIWKANEEMPNDCKLSEGLCECANEHEQLADWLEELQYLRKVVMFMRHNNVVGLVENYLREEANNDKERSD